VATEKRGKVKLGKRRMVLTAAEKEAKEKAAKAKSSARLQSKAAAAVNRWG
jgi:hypothetical protein